MINNLEAYKVFYYVAKCGSVTKAAGELSISQPAVSQAIKQLENTLDAALFHRAAKGVRLTSEGELLYSYVAKGYEQIEMGVKKVHQMQNMELGEVRIGASDMTLQFYLLPYLEKFHEQYPGIKVIVTNAPTPETLNYLREGHIDFGIVSTPFPERPDIQMIPVREIEDVFVAGRRFFSYKNRTLDFQKLESLPLIFLEKNTSSRSYMDEFLADKGFDAEMIKKIAKASIMHPLWAEYDRGTWTDEQVLAAFVKDAPELEKELHQAFENIAGMVTPRAYAIPWLQELKAKGYHVYYLSNFSHKAETECAEALNFLPEMEGGILSYKDQLIKPEPEIYQLLLKRYGLKADESVFLDDTLVNVKAAEEQGIHGIHFLTKEQAEEELRKLGVDC